MEQRSSRRPTRYVLAAAGALVALSAPLAACGDDDSSSTTTTASKATTEASKVTESDVWARPGDKGGNSAVYMMITGGSEPDALTGASVPTDVAAKTEVHETKMASGGSSTTAMGGEKSGMESTTTTAMGGSGSGDQTTTTGQMMTMAPVDRIDIPANGSVELKPGGYHVMLLSLAKDLKAGDTIKVTLTFEKAGEQTVDATVKQP